MQSTLVLERKEQIIEDLTNAYLQITKRKLFNLRLFPRRKLEKEIKALIEFSNRRDAFRATMVKYAQETHLTKEEIIEIKLLLLVKARQLEKGLYLRLIKLSSFLFQLPCGVALVILQKRIDSVLIFYAIMLMWLIISFKLLNTKHKLQRTLHAYEATSNSLDEILNEQVNLQESL
ncbi:MAG: hypothetical protein WAQ98_18580 [Blastocatellia bacterium]